MFMNINDQIDEIKTFYVDSVTNREIKTDDFIVCIGQKQSNSVYHVIESNKRIFNNRLRFTVKVFKSDLITCLKRTESQNLIPMIWYK